MDKIKNQNGAITIIVLVTVLFMISFLVTTYIISSNKVKSEKEIISEIKDIYSPKYSMEEIYNSYFENDSIIPIYEEEELLNIGTEKQVSIKGKIYKFSKDGIYILKNDIELNLTELRLEDNWIPFIYKDDFKGTFDFNGNEIIVTLNNGTKMMYP